MNITVINGQNHRGSTWNIGNQLIGKLGEGHQVTEFFLARDMPHACIGCFTCFLKGEEFCPHHELMAPIITALDSADLIVLTSPVYVMGVSGAMKNVLDHLGWRWMVHRPNQVFFRKQGVVIATSAGALTRTTLNGMADSLKFWGVPIIHRIGIAVNELNWDKVKPGIKKRIDRKTTRTAKAILRHDGKAHATLFQKGLFLGMRMINKKGWNEKDTAYWRERGWLNGKYPWKQQGSATHLMKKSKFN
ncbi:MAG: NAD(P)H-dependent oxidoreductase [Chloroflexi bacterium]|nr:NAD(P)H-dependent oxidoreductase [Chloroflexota bacterium]